MDPDFDFVVGPDAPGADEDLPQPRRRQLPGGPRLHRAVLAGVVAAAAGVVLATHVHGPGPHHPAAAGQPTPRHTAAGPTRSAFPGNQEIVTVPGARRAGHDIIEVMVPTLLPLPACPAHSVPFTPACTHRRSVPRAFTRALHGTLPGTSLIATRTELRASGIWTRSYTARLGAATLRIEVRLAAAAYPLDYQSIDDGFRSIVYAQRRVGPRTVQVMVTAPSGRAPYDRQVRRLAADPRLLALR